jgi:hypothetical protein
VLLLLTGCGSSSPKLPAACDKGPVAVEQALAKAPGSVAIDGTRISDCFVRNASSDDVQIVGTDLLTAAQQLGDKARAGSATAALQLGYLIGAAERGAMRSGVAGELIRRLEAETAVGAPQQGAYDRGLRAGEAGG